MELPLRMIVAGGRNQQVWPEDYLALARFVREHNVVEVVHGAHPGGVDKAIDEWAKLNELPVRPFPADWDRFGRAAGPIRNGAMARYGDVLVAFPGGRGTADMVKQAEAAGLPVYQLCKTGRRQSGFLQNGDANG